MVNETANGIKVYTDAKDIDVSGRIFYVKTGALYTDAAAETAAEGGAVFQAFLAGNLTIVDNGVIYKGVSATVSSTTVTVTYGAEGSATATTAADDTTTAVEFAKIVPSNS